MTETVTLDLSKATALPLMRQAFLDGRLSAQNRTPGCFYRDRSGCPCLVGAVMPDDFHDRKLKGTMSNVHSLRTLLSTMGDVEVLGVHAEDPEQSKWLNEMERLQDLHDGWCRYRNKGDAQAASAYAEELRDALGFTVDTPLYPNRQPTETAA